MAREELQLEAKRFTTTAALAKAASVLLAENAECQITVVIGATYSFDDIGAELSALNVAPDRIEIVRRNF